MLNGKFFTGLPPQMIDRSGNPNRQQTNFFWPDDTQSQSAVESRVKRRSSLQAESRSAYSPQSAPSQSDAEVKERFKKEFTKSSIQFYDNVEPTPSLRRNRQKLTEPPTRKPQNVTSPAVASTNNRKEAYTSKIQFYDYGEDLNNVPRTDKNNKVDVERNTKNSPKLQNKQMVLQPPDEAINFIENNVKNVRISAPPRRRNTVKDNRPRYISNRAAPPEDVHYSDLNEDYQPPTPRRLGIPQPPPTARGRYYESDPDLDVYSTPRRMPLTNHRRPMFYEEDTPDYIDIHHPPPPRTRPVPRQLDYDDEAVYSRKSQRQVHFSNSMAATTSHSSSDHQPQVNILKVDNEIQNNEAAAASTSSGASHKHLVSNICLSDTESHATPPCPPKRNIRSSAVNRVSVGLPD